MGIEFGILAMAIMTEKSLITIVCYCLISRIQIFTCVKVFFAYLGSRGDKNSVFSGALTKK